MEQQQIIVAALRVAARVYRGQAARVRSNRTGAVRYAWELRRQAGAATQLADELDERAELEAQS